MGAVSYLFLSLFFFHLFFSDWRQSFQFIEKWVQSYYLALPSEKLKVRALSSIPAKNWLRGKEMGREMGRGSV